MLDRREKMPEKQVALVEGAVEVAVQKNEVKTS